MTTDHDAEQLADQLLAQVPTIEATIRRRERAGDPLPGGFTGDLIQDGLEAARQVNAVPEDWEPDPEVVAAIEERLA